MTKLNESSVATNRSLRWTAWFGVVCLLIITCVDPPYPEPLVLQHIPTVLMLAVLAACIQRRWLTGLSISACLLFVVLHIIGARWIYSFVPYDQFSERWLGRSVSSLTGWTRNHYDRLVHLASGVLFAIPAAECLQRFAGMTPRAAALQSIAVVIAIGAAYEIAEWQLAVWMSPESAEAYNGQQGDVWDPQKDMALAAIGAIISAGFIGRRSCVEAAQ